MSDAIFSWVPTDSHANALSASMKIDDLPDEEWLKLVWKDILDAETSHYRFLTEEVC